MAGYFYRKMVFPKVKKIIERYNMFSPGDKVLVGVSGGPDSVCLLHILNRCRKEMALSLHIVHINHGIRKRESKREEKFVSHLAGRMGLPITVKSLDVPSYARRKKLTVEEAARDMRYSAFEQLAGKLNAKKIALGHTASDQVETVLMHLLRGSGPQGLSGIPPVRKLGSSLIVRPLIEVNREEILNYLKKNKLTFCLDSSNRKTEYFRNKVRLKLLPLLRKNYNKNIDGALLRLSEILKEENACWERVVERVLGKVVSWEAEKILIDFKKFLRYNVIVQRRVLYRLFGGIVSLSQIEAIRSLAQKSSQGKRIYLGKRFSVRKEGNFLIFSSSPERRFKKFNYPLRVPGKNEIEGLNLTLNTRIVDFYPVSEKETNTAYFDVDKINFKKLLLRNRREGDRFRPFGLRGTKKLSDFFIDRKIPRRLRDRVPLLVEGEDILWVVGIRRADKARITEDTKKILEVRVLREEES
ncbi:MAG: tRNA lysidine(34) synthetase TilS [Elusimicrobia bacterium]|nr:MAG: tRNA lysidine(34) synthetase TilS [Elusimicrobiota bacterium]